MFALILFEPEIPPNTGNIIRLCANVGAELHLVEPLGFDFADRSLRRAGLDYHEYVTVRRHADWRACRAVLVGRRIFALSSKAGRCYSDAAFLPDDVFLFGPETRGLPAYILDKFPSEQRLHLPMRAGNRSLNLANAAAVTVYEAWRQQGFRGSED
ncbi:MAG: tRNA (cytidine(34)-2'-O)-methyltransferase [Zoogloeaceae bacterium]|jgi:tRNA (cytidine/uridine-2'-O-)-methyltransferase|nr:tRNA (cytidine(34)-2'-O)-methyltransferase [Zoogloeaceae bacterium]